MPFNYLLTEGKVKELYILCSNGMRNQKRRQFSQLWSQALDAVCLCLAEEETTVLSELGTVLGRYDCASQCEALRNTRERLNQSLSQAKENRARMGKVYSTLGVTAGAFLVIVLL